MKVLEAKTPADGEGPNTALTVTVMTTIKRVVRRDGIIWLEMRELIMLQLHIPK